MAEVFLTFSLDTARNELTRVWDGLPKGSGDGALRAALRTAYDSLSTVTQTGLIVSGTSAGGHSVTFSEPGKGGDKPQTRQQMFGYLIELADELSNRTPAPTDVVLYADMLANLRPAYSFANSFAGLRFA